MQILWIEDGGANAGLEPLQIAPEIFAGINPSEASDEDVTNRPF